jgi:predicted secreted Zn-dependent protease
MQHANRTKTAVALCLLLALVPYSTQGETIIRKSTTYFRIGGRTAADIDREMKTRGPMSSVTGRRHPGATKIKFDGAATFVSGKGNCRIGGAKVSLNTKLLLPRWTNRKKANAKMALVWDTLSSDIKRHEERHAEIARSYARDLEKAILALRPAKSCDVLKAKVSRLSNDLLAAHDKAQQQFDRIEAANFENRMARLLKYRLQKNKATN